MKPLAPAVAIAAVALVASAHGQSTPTTLHLVNREAHFGFIDVKPKGAEKRASNGDTVFLGGKLTGDLTGTSNLVCSVTFPGHRSSAFACHGTLVFAGGTITAEGVTHGGTKTDTLAVTGGTGDYEGASGTIVNKALPKNRDSVTITLAG